MLNDEMYYHFQKVKSAKTADPRLQFAIDEIKRLYGHDVYARKGLHKYGRVTGFGASETLISSIYDLNGGIEWGSTGNAVLSATDNVFTSIVSSDNSDTGTVTIEGHTRSGDDYVFTIQTVTLTGQTPVALSTTLCTVTYLTYSSGTTAANAGSIYVYYGTATSGVPDTVANIANVIKIGAGKATHAATTFSQYDYFVPTYIRVGLSKTSGASAACTFRARSRTSTSSWATQWTMDTVREAGPYFEQFDPYYIIAPNMSVAITAEGSATGLSATAVFGGYICTIIT